MSGKLVIAVILALHVTVSLCELPALPTPSPELVEKYNKLRETFYKRWGTAIDKVKGAIEPLAAENPQAGAAKEYIEDLQTKPEVKDLVKIATNVASELAPAVDKVRSGVLGLYEKYIRPWAGEHLDKVITSGQAALEEVVPVEKH